METKTEVINYINSLDTYEGYVQFSHRPIDKNKDIFYDGKNVKVEDESGFIYEAHFCNGTNSIQIRQVNDSWLISETDISHTNDEVTQEYITDIENFPYKVKMAQIWESENDKFCEDMEVKRLKKVLFAGFKGETK